MTVANGNPADETTFNSSFMSREANTDTVGTVGLNNSSDPNSGASISNTQRLINEIRDTVGVTGEGDANRKIYASNNFLVDGQDHKQGLEALDAGILAGGGNDFWGVYQTLDVIGANGTTYVVTAEFTTKSPLGTATTQGVVTAPPNNLVQFVDATDGTEIEDGSGRRVFSRLTEAAGVWTLSFYVNIAGVETAHNLASTDLAILYIEVFNSANRPTFSETGVNFDSLNATADILDASGTQDGKVNQVAQTFAGAKNFVAQPTFNGSDILSTNNAKVVTNKDIDGGVASNTNRITIPSDTTANLNGLTRKEATLVYSTDDDVLKIDDGVTLTDVGTGAVSGEKISHDVNQTTHGFVVGDVLSHNATVFVKGDASDSNLQRHYGMVTAVADVDNFTITSHGRITGLSGLTAGGLHYLSDSVPGTITITAPATLVPVFIAISTTEGILLDYSESVASGTPPAPSVYQGDTAGYTLGGFAGANINRIEKFSFTSDGNSTDVADLTVARRGSAGQLSSTHGYAAGGINGGTSNVIDKFLFATDANATDVGDLTVVRRDPAGQSSANHGYASGGVSSNVIDKHTFSSDANATDVGDLTVTRGGPAGQTSSTHGYSSGGDNGGLLNTVDKFTFASDANATDVGDLTEARGFNGGSSSTTHGFTHGGDIAGGTDSVTIDKFTFASDANATDVGDLIVAGSFPAGATSTTHGYRMGGQGPDSNVIEKYSHVSDANATDVGDLTTNITQSTGTHV